MFLGRDSDLSTAVGILLDGSSLDVVGGRSSGRTTFLDILASTLANEEWEVLRVNAIASLRTHPLAAVQLAGFGAALESRPGPSAIPAVTEAIAELTRRRPTAILVDDWDDLDETSWGVIQAVAREGKSPVAISRLQGRRALLTPSGLAPATTLDTFVVEMRPLKFDEIARVVVDALGGPIEPAALSRIYARSGGIVGLARSLARAAARDGRLQSKKGVWNLTRDLWSPTMRVQVEARLESLDAHERDALEMLAHAGTLDLDTAEDAISWEVLESLETNGLVRLFSSGGRRLITTFPPLIADYFRHERLGLRRIRLTRQLNDAFEDSKADLAAEPAQLISPSATVPEDDALFVRLTEEQTHTRLLIARSNWQRSRSTATAAAYAAALLSARAPAERIDEVFEAVDGSEGRPEDRAQFYIVRAQWRAYRGADIDGALDDLASHSRELGVFGRLLDACAVRIQLRLTTIPADFEASLDVTDDLPGSVKGVLLETRASALTCLGRLADARAALREIDRIYADNPDYWPNMHLALVLLGQGEAEEALAEARRGFDEARANLDAEALRAHAYVVTLCLMLEGRYREVDEVLDTVLAIGAPPQLPQLAYLGLMVIESVVSIRLGRMAQAEDVSRKLDSIPVPDGPLPGMSRSWARAQLLAFSGDLKGAANLLWQSSDELWQRGGRFAAAFGYLTSLELLQSQSRLIQAREKISLLDSRLLTVQLSYVSALVDHDPDALRATVDALRAVGRSGYAVTALNLAMTWYRESGREADAASASSDAQALTSSLEVGTYDAFRYVRALVQLSDREQEIVLLMADGLSNQQIATRLVLSIRTIESHINRMLAKTGSRNRQELLRLVATGQPT
jgi:DNA-binding CsgD family transcriptional regulator